MIWYLRFNGLTVDIRHDPAHDLARQDRGSPREAQAVANAWGLIPYIPTDRRPDSQE